MSGTGREILPDVMEWSGGPSGCPRVVGRPSRISGSGREAFLDVREWSGSPPEYPRVVGMPSRMSGSGREVLGICWSCLQALPNVGERCGGPPT